jgi:hypothetical protein
MKGIDHYFAKLTIGTLLMVTHFGSIGFILIGGLSVLPFDTLISSILILTPLTVTYVTLFLKDLTRIQFVDSAVDLRKIRPSAFIIQILFILLFASSLFTVIGTYIWHGSMTQDQFKIVLGVIESAVGVFVGTITSAIFETK